MIARLSYTLVTALISSFFPTVQVSAEPPSAPVTALVAATVIDVTSGRTSPDSVVLIKDGRIAAIGPRQTTVIPKEAQTINMGGRWLLPGLINSHVHLGLALSSAGAEGGDESTAHLALRMADNARKTLRAGVTTVRLVGERDGTDVILREAARKGLVEAPRIFTAGAMIGPPGGHGIAVGKGVSGAAAFSNEVRFRIEHRADWIKLPINGGMVDHLAQMRRSYLEPDELKAVVDTAHRNGVPVTVHATYPEAVAEAIAAGIDCVEHGYHLDIKTFKMMKQRDVFFVPAMSVSQPGALQIYQKTGAPKVMLDRLKAVGEDHLSALKAAIRVGTPIAMGTDQFPFESYEGTTATVRELEIYVEAGMSPLDALRTATINAAQLLRRPAEFGRLEVGFSADIIALERDPTHDITALRTLRFVMARGLVVRQDF